MDSFEDVEEISDMPREELCSYCFGARLRMMQSSPYSAYDDMYAYMLEFVNQSRYFRAWPGGGGGSCVTRGAKLMCEYRLQR